MGHAGTLDPAATGVLVLGVGPVATRLIEYVQEQPKVYQSVFILGSTSTTDDGDGTITPFPVEREPTEKDLRSALERYLGTFAQVPPVYSAALVEGKRAYDLARRGEEVRLQPRPVTIHANELVRFAYPEVEVRVSCGRGTYIRSLARDLGNILKTGAYVSQLRRVQVGGFMLEQAAPWEATGEEAARYLQPHLAAVTLLPRYKANEEQLRRLRMGQRIVWREGDKGHDADVAIMTEDGKLAGIGIYESGTEQLRPRKMLSL